MDEGEMITDPRTWGDLKIEHAKAYLAERIDELYMDIELDPDPRVLLIDRFHAMARECAEIQDSRRAQALEQVQSGTWLPPESAPER